VNTATVSKEMLGSYQLPLDSCPKCIT